ncbi:MAG: hypothetical protein MJD61_00100 [Proteobacteria bacterium]|nr:hypothetical protein [Pseudomonadota bacterium]
MIPTRRKLQPNLTRIAMNPAASAMVRLRALDQLAKTLGLYLQEVQHQGEIGHQHTWAALVRAAANSA